jgi:hypothetical protein
MLAANTFGREEDGGEFAFTQGDVDAALAVSAEHVRPATMGYLWQLSGYHGRLRRGHFVILPPPFSFKVNNS